MESIRQFISAEFCLVGSRAVRGVCLVAIPLAIALAMIGCNQNTASDATSGGATDSGESGGTGDGSRPKVIATTTIVADLVANVAGDSVELVTLMPPGRDPHQVTLTARDIFELRTADLIFYNGLSLEGKVENVYKELKEKGVETVAVSAGISGDRIMKPEGIHPDPHVWGDPMLWSECVRSVVDALKEVAPYAASGFELRGNAYRFELKRLDDWIKGQVANVPWANPRRRVLVTSHDAFGYWGRAYQFEVASLQGISTVGEVTPSEIAKMVDFVKELEVPVIFVETSTNKGPIQRVATDAKVKIGGLLYSDSLGGDYTPTFKLRLQEIGSAKELPDAGVGNIYLGRLPDKSIHIRMFSDKGQKIFDRAGREISGGIEKIAQLKDLLGDSWQDGYVAEDIGREAVAMIKDLVDYKPPAKNSAAGDDPGPETELPLTGENIDVRTYVGMMKYNAYKIASELKAGITPERLNEAAKSSAEKGMLPER